MIRFERLVTRATASMRIGDEYAETRWACFHGAPLFALETEWVGGGRRTRVALSDPSAVRGLYFCFVLTLLTMLGGLRAAEYLAIACVLLALSRPRRRATKVQRDGARFCRVVYGIACPPELLADRDRAELHDALLDRWPAIGNGRTPDDVLRLGARTELEAAVAYVLLVLAGYDLTASRIAAPRADREADADSPADPYRLVAQIDDAGGFPIALRADRPSRVRRLEFPLLAFAHGAVMVGAWVAAFRGDPSVSQIARGLAAFLVGPIELAWWYWKL